MSAEGIDPAAFRAQIAAARESIAAKQAAIAAAFDGVALDAEFARLVDRQRRSLRAQDRIWRRLRRELDQVGQGGQGKVPGRRWRKLYRQIEEAVRRDAALEDELLALRARAASRSQPLPQNRDADGGR